MKRKIIGRVIYIAILLVSITAAVLLIWTNTALTKPKGEQAVIPDNPLLILVNSDYHIPKDYEINLLELSNGQKVDERIYPDLQKMFDNMRAENYSPYVREGYRTAAEQKEILTDTIAEHIKNGSTPIAAYNQARNTVAAVGNSEHQLGLAVDINPISGSANEWGVYPWLAEHSWEYGFILRYPEGKTDITGISYEPWHFRYVGKTAAMEIHFNNLTLEEYISEKSNSTATM